MSAPKRIQLRRSKGWRKPEGCIVVARPTKWGNPWRVVRAGAALFVCRPGWTSVCFDNDRAGAAERVVSNYRTALQVQLGYSSLRIWPEMVIRELRGHDLACWCPLDQPCHADVLLELANT